MRDAGTTPPSDNLTIRAAGPEDAAAIVAIQRSSPEAAQWDVADYSVYVAGIGRRIVGFLVSRTVAEGEIEILNLAVEPSQRRSGVARRLVRRLLEGHCGDVFLEVRESNVAARKLYESLGFQELGRRTDYYQSPPESGVVMKFHSC